MVRDGQRRVALVNEISPLIGGFTRVVSEEGEMRVWLLTAAIALSGMNAEVAGAATTIGQSPPTAGVPLAGNCNVQSGFLDFVQAASTSGNPYELPAGGGVITSWTSRALETGSFQMRLRLFTVSGPPFNAVTPVAESAEQAVGTLEVRSRTHLPVNGGEVIGLSLKGSGTCAHQQAAPGDVIAVGTTGPIGTPETTPTNTAKALLNVSAQLEADSDKDGFGDETEDCAPGDVSKNTDCSVPDADPPSADFTKAPKKKSTSRTATFKFASDESGVTYQCAIDKKPLKPCASPKKFRKLRFRRHTFKLVATDAAGNASEQTTFRWRVVD
jgi:hypothetical protein